MQVPDARKVDIGMGVGVGSGFQEIWVQEETFLTEGTRMNVWQGERTMKESCHSLFRPGEAPVPPYTSPPHPLPARPKVLGVQLHRPG